MDNLTLILAGITLLFFIMLAVKSILKLKKLCVMCASITLTWIALLVLYFLNMFTDKIVIAILIGHTSLGVYYLLEKRVKRNVLIFRLPLLLTFILITYSILNGFVISSLYFIFGLWLFFLVIYLLKNNKLAKKMIECCKRW